MPTSVYLIAPNRSWRAYTHAYTQYLLDHLRTLPSQAIPDVLNETFHAVDGYLSRLAEESDGKIHSGCTAVTAFLRVEDEEGGQSFLRANAGASSSADGMAISIGNSTGGGPPAPDSPEPMDTDDGSTSPMRSASPEARSQQAKKGGGSRFVNALKTLTGGSGRSTPSTPRSLSPTRTSPAQNGPVIVPPPNARRVLYSANAGDARGVLCRSGRAIRLTYDHKGTDRQEAKRITDAGGFVMSGRVNGVLNVTRSLGDSSMKEFVVGSPYTTETELCDADEFVILACDGVRLVSGNSPMASADT